jgi:hypothetical protein
LHPSRVSSHLNRVKVWRSIITAHVMRSIRKKQSSRFQPVENCEDEIALIGDYLLADLCPAVRRSFEIHLAECRDCAAFLRTYIKTIEVMHAVLQEQPSTDKPNNRPIVSGHKN